VVLVVLPERPDHKGPRVNVDHVENKDCEGQLVNKENGVILVGQVCLVLTDNVDKRDLVGRQVQQVPQVPWDHLVFKAIEGREDLVGKLELLAHQDNKEPKEKRVEQVLLVHEVHLVMLVKQEKWDHQDVLENLV